MKNSFDIASMDLYAFLNKACVYAPLMNVLKLFYGIECVCVCGWWVGARASLCLCVNVLCLYLCDRLCVTMDPGYRTMSLVSFSHS